MNPSHGMAEAVEAVARILAPDAFEKASGYGHAEFAEDDRERRTEARTRSRAILAATAPILYQHWQEQLLSAAKSQLVNDRVNEMQVRLGVAGADPNHDGPDPEEWAECMAEAAIRAATESLQEQV
jgi:hypothetical protein